jgi:AcrR family transcriptional regulator
MNSNQSTSERILAASLHLFCEQGYKGTTTKAIAEKAGVNEVTIFRHFGNKRAILNAAIDSLSYAPYLGKIIQEKMTFDLEKDLLLIAINYHEYMDSIRDFVMIGFREAGMFPEIDEEISKIPKMLKENLVGYFSTMTEQGKIIETDLEAQAMNFIWLNFGYFISRTRLGDQVISVSREAFLKQGVLLFARGLTP